MRKALWWAVIGFWVCYALGSQIAWGLAFTVVVTIIGAI